MILHLFFNGNITLFWKITSKHFFGALKLARFRKTSLSCPKRFNDFELLPSFSLVVNVNLFYYQMIQLQIFVMNFCNFTPIESEFNSSKPCLQGWSLILEKGYKNPRSLLTSYMYRIHDILALFLQPFVYLIAVIGSYFVSPCGCDKYANLLHPKRWDFNLIRYILAGGSHFFFFFIFCKWMDIILYVVYP